MSKYIDADKLLKSTIAKFKCVPLVGVPSCRNGEEYFDGETFDTLINETPTADVVEVVRCKDCVFAEEGFDECDVYCKINDVSFGKDSFCSYGERREGCLTRHLNTKIN